MKSRARSDPQKTLVGFVVGDIHYAIDIARVVQIVNPMSVDALPHLPAAVVGVADYRGDVLPVLDLRSRFGLPPSGATRRTKWIVVNLGALAALVVDRVVDVFGTHGAELRPAPDLGGGDDQRGILGVTSHDGKLTFVLDLARLRPVLESAMAGLRGSSPPARQSSPVGGRP